MMTTVETNVKNLYTEFTYPKYEKKIDDASKPFLQSYNLFSFLEQLNYYNYSGSKHSFDNFKVLIAGSGVGNDLLQMNLLLNKYKNYKIVGIDLSPTCVNVVKERIRNYNAKNCEVHNMSILDLNETMFGKFDYIICIGVLHHLENPTEGLNRLKSVLKEDGMLNVMVYGKIGRTGVYQMQDMLRLINSSTPKHTYQQQISTFKNIYKSLPHTNWFMHTDKLISDHKTSDEGIVDLLLHCQDVSYNIKELFEWIKKSDLQHVEFTPYYRWKYNYENPELPVSFNNVNNKYMINELYFGDIICHTFYLSNKKSKQCELENLDNVLLYVLFDKSQLISFLNNNLKNTELTYNAIPSKIFNYNNRSYKIKFSTTSFTIKFTNTDIIQNILECINGVTTTRTIFQLLRDKLNKPYSNTMLLKIFKPIYEICKLYDGILLKTNML
jgi:2-polyprenyl-3-methyl-5-hydroxy-6-metoxy-1,4-benzoquinol methylase